jgi:maleylpyruvate isomerase
MSDATLGHERSTDIATLAQEVTRQLAAIEHATEAMLNTVESLDELSVRQPSLLDGWSRAHVITHLARNADGCTNLLIWARTGIEHPMYASGDDRDDAIEEGAVHSHRLLMEDLAAASERFANSARALPVPAWAAELYDAAGDPMPAHHTLRIRLLEVWVHTVDLDCDLDFADIPATHAEQLLEDVAQFFGGRPDVPALSLEVDFGTHRRNWELRGTTEPSSRVSGAPGPMLGWLLGRTDAEELSGSPPDLPEWL